MNIFQTLESEVRSYCRGWPVTFDRASGTFLYDENGKEYLDFFAGAGSLNYGHNNPVLKRAVLDYIERSTLAKGEQIDRSLTEIVESYPDTPMRAKGRGLARGLQFEDETLAEAVCRQAFEHGLLMETSAPVGEVVKLMPPLTISDAELEQGLSIVGQAVKRVLG